MPRFGRRALGATATVRHVRAKAAIFSAMSRPAWSLQEPTAAAVNAFLKKQENAPLGYAHRGASRGSSPSGYDLDHNCAQIGRGEGDFRTACAALRRWAMFPSAWTRIEPAAAPIHEGQTVAMIAHAFGWWMNACRIVYVLDETEPVRRFGFAYGTLPAHVEEGEERFAVEFHPDESVWYDLRAFSRPRQRLVRLAKPLARRLQRRFVHDSQLAMRAAVRLGEAAV
jgi:uncharacterized protein (UPF0548 family)